MEKMNFNVLNTEEDSSAKRLFENVEGVLSDDKRLRIPTGADKLDATLRGGLCKGELGVIIAPIGAGKTSATTGFAANAATYKCEANDFNGYKVLHYFFDDAENNIERKYMGFITGFEACELNLSEMRPIVIGKLNEDIEICRMLRNNIKYERLISGEVTASQIKEKIRNEISLGFRPDLVIIDSFDSIKSEDSDNTVSEWTKETFTLRKIKAMAHEFNTAIWVPVNGTRDSICAELISLIQTSGSFKKLSFPDVILTFAATENMKSQGKMNISLRKFRAGRIDRNKFFNVSFNNGTCRFDMSECDDGTGTFFCNFIQKRTKQMYKF